MKLLPVEYLGYTAMDKRFSSPMLPWVITEIRRRGTIDKICVGVEDGTLQAYDTNFEQQFTHNVEHMVRFSRATTDGRSFMYLLRDPTNPLLYCHLFRATRNEDVSELFKQMREQGGVAGQQVAGSTPVTGVAKQCTLPGRSISSAANLTSLCADISPSSSHFFEVLYIGKIKVSHRKVPDTFIDDALCKFQAHEQQKLKEKSTHQSQTTRGCVPDDRRGSVDSTTSDTGSVESLPSHTLNNPTLISPLTPLDPSKSFASHADSEQYAALCIPPIDSAIVAKRAIYAKSERTRTISEGSESGIKIQRTRTSTDMSDYATGDDEKNVPEPQSYTSLEKNCNLEKNISRSFENVQTLGQTNPSLDKNKNVLIGNNTQLATTIGGRKCGSTEALPTGSADKQQDVAMKNVNEQPDPFSRTRSSSIGNGSVLKRQDSSEHNRTMVFQVGRTDLRLISPDRKQVLVHKQLKDVVSCIQGIKNTEHFGFICREVNIEFFMGYVFKCQSAAVSVDVVQAITQAYQATNEAHKHRERPVIMSCDHCPMVWYHRLCTEVENQSDRKTQAIIFRRISNLDEEEQNVILTKFRGAETDSIREQNEFLMMLLRAHCEAKQNRHMHDTAENRSEFLNQYLGGSTIFMKAKRSLTNSFDHLLKRKGSRDDFGPNLSLPLSRENSPHPQSLEVPSSDFIPDAPRSRTSTLSSTNGDERPPTLRVSPDHSSGKEDKLKSPMMDIFFKVGSSPKSENSSDSRNQSTSWRQEMFNRVVTPSKTDSAKHTRRKRDKEELRMLWKKAINQALLLIRMEKENARLRARQEESAVKRIKLEYDEICPCQRELMDVWELLVSKESRISTKCDTQMLLQAIRQGVPRSKRGEVWHFLAEQFCMKQPPIDTTNFPNYNTPYENLLKQLTSHQHAILIDLGRTFPNHTYFSSPLGPGQLALFNLLKAYSLLDPEVGYCQGLSFVAGVLLLHMSEDEAFFLLRHLMFRRGLRKQYLPDMVALQVHLYQLSRLLHDQIPELYEHFNKHEVVPTLYAAPWVLTIFASQFPLGFVTRVFDLLFLESPDVIFRAAIALLNHHKEGLLMCDSFEEIMDFLKNTVPSIDKKTFEKVLKQVFMSDITKQLNEYQVEYHVLQEEMASVRPQLDSLEKMEHQNKTLREQNKALMDQLELALSNAQRLETTRTVHLSTINRLESQSRSLEVTVNTLGNFINNIIEKKLDIEIPGDVRRIVSQIALSEQRRNNAAMSKANVPTMRRLEPQKTMVKSLSMGKLGLNFNKSKDEMVARSHSVNTGLGNILAQNLKQSEEVDKQNTLLNNINANLNKIEDKGHRGIPLRVIEDNSTYEPVSKQVSNKQAPPHPLKTTLSQPALGSKSGFFANSHNHIQQQRMNSLALKQGLTTDTKTNLIQNMTDHSNKIITDVSNKPQLYQNQNQFTQSLTSKLESTLALTNNSNNNNNEKSVSLPLDVHNIYKHDEFRTENPYEIHKDVSLDSGISTPMSPIKENTICEIPLYDSDVNFTFNGTSQLKSIKPVPKVVKTQQ